jgi:hypothetical protein
MATETESPIVNQSPLKSTNKIEIEMKPEQLQKLLESGLLSNTHLHIKLS